MKASEIDKLCQKMTSNPIMGAFISKIYKPKTYQKHLNNSISLDHLNKAIDVYAKKQQDVSNKLHANYQKSSVGHVHKNLIKYSKHQISVGDLISLPHQRQQGQEIYEEDNMIKYRQVMLERKYNIPFSVKLAILKQTEGIRQEKIKYQKLKQHKKLLRQPLIKDMNRLLRQFRQKQNQVVQQGQKNKKHHTFWGSVSSSLNQTHNQMSIDYIKQQKNQRKQKNFSQHSNHKQKSVKLQRNSYKNSVFLTVPHSQNTLSKRHNLKRQMRSTIISNYDSMNESLQKGIKYKSKQNSIHCRSNQDQI